MDRPDGYDLYLEEGMQAEEARYYEEMERIMDKKEQLQWIIDNINKIEITKIYTGGYTGTPTLLLEIDSYELAESSPFSIDDSCIMFE